MKGMRTIAPMGVRIPDDMKEKIQERAKKNGRSMNSEIIMLLEHALTREAIMDRLANDDGGYDGTDDYQQKILIAKEALWEAINMLNTSPLKKLSKD
ncbi:TPA: Arc family DNA-binding protein [Yersinia enterocolitica]